jgi:hypothetical protein
MLVVKFSMPVLMPRITIMVRIILCKYFFHIIILFHLSKSHMRLFSRGFEIFVQFVNMIVAANVNGWEQKKSWICCVNKNFALLINYSCPGENIVSGGLLAISITKTIAGYICTKRRFRE